MGDLVQTLPAITDASRAIPGVRFDWVCDEAFAQVPSWHPSVDRIIEIGLGRWRRGLLRAVWQGEPRAFLKELRGERYDAVVDVQCVLKSALAAGAARGRRYGYDRRAAHEWGAQFFYDRKLSVPRDQHSIDRMRQLVASALNYVYDRNTVDYGADRDRLPAMPLRLKEPYLVFIHSTSWTSKNWAEPYWRQLTTKATSAGFHVVLPWGNQAERDRALRIAAGNQRVVVMPPLTISEKAAVIVGAYATVGLDTGLSHIAAAFGVPSVTIYGATDPRLVGATGKYQVHIASQFVCKGCHSTRCAYKAPNESRPACMVEISPERVWLQLQDLTAKKARP